MTVPAEAWTAVRDLWPHHEVTFFPLRGGMTNRNWKAGSPGRWCVVQVQLDDTAAAQLGIDRVRQQRAHNFAAEVGVAPRVLLRRADLGVVVCAWQEGAALLGPGERSPAIVRSLGRVLATLHSGPCDDGMRCLSAEPFAGTHLMRRRAREVARSAADTFDFAFPVLERIEVLRGPVTPTLAHGDLLAGNILCADDGVRLIDFEYAAVSDPLYDLGDLAGKNTFDRDEISILVDAYGAAHPEHSAQMVGLFRFVSLLREGLWAVAASQNCAVDFDYLGYAEALVGRLQLMLDEPGFGHDLGSVPVPTLKE